MTHSVRTTPPADAPGSLATLVVAAPAHVADDVLVEVGLADRMAPLDSPSGGWGRCTTVSPSERLQSAWIGSPPRSTSARCHR